MNKLFPMNDDIYRDANPRVKDNVFLGREPENTPLPKYEDVRDSLPEPVWEGHDSVIACYNKVWEIAFGNLRQPTPGTHFVSNFIDTAFNGDLFMWDSSFIMMFGKYARHVFDFQGTLDNFYSHQHGDGFICREIFETADGAQFTRDDPASTGPNVLPWAEWEYFLSTGDRERLAQVFDPLMAYHTWLRKNRSWKDGTYWSCGLASGMDNQPRQPEGYAEHVSHGFMSWIDATAQGYISGEILLKMAKILGREGEKDVLELEREAAFLRDFVRKQMWSEKDGFFYDLYRDGSFGRAKTIGAYWTLLAGIADEKQAARMAEHLENPEEFNRPVRVPSLSRDDPHYEATGAYWRGGVWAPTNYMVLRGLTRYGYDRIAHEIGCSYLDAVVRVFEETGTVFENYAPEKAEPGVPAKKDFVGWTGIAPVTVLFEYVFGIRPDCERGKILWDIRLTERHGVLGYRFGDKTVDLICEARSSVREKPRVTVRGDVDVEIIWNHDDE